MNEDVLASNLRESVKKAEEVKKVIDQIYYSSDLSTFFNRPFLTMLSTGADFLVKNLRIMAQRYEAHLLKKG